MKRPAAIGTLTLLLCAASATAQELPPIPPDLLNQAVLACIKIGDNGHVTAAFLIKPTGDATRDRGKSKYN